MKKRILSMLMAILLIVSLVPTQVLAPHVHAEGNFVAEVGNTQYTTLQEAIDAADEANPITLLGNVTLSEGLVTEEDDRIILDLAGYTISYAPSEAKATAAITNNGRLTIKDSSAEGTGKVTYESSAPSSANAYATNTITNCGMLFINGGTIENNTSGGASYAVDVNSTLRNAKLTLNNGKIVSKGVAVRQFANSVTCVSGVQINDGVVEGSRALFIQLPGSTNEVKWASLDILGGTITCTNSADLAVYSYSFGDSYSNTNVVIKGGTFNGDVYFHGGSSNGGSGSERVTISGGTFNAVGSYGSTTTADISITGGLYNTDPSDYVAEGYNVCEVEGQYCVEPYKAAQNQTTGNWYPSIEAAIEAAAEGDTILVALDTIEMPAITKKKLTFVSYLDTRVTSVSGVAEGTTFDGFEFAVRVGFTAKDLTLRNCKFTADNGVYYGCGSGTWNVENCEFRNKIYAFQVGESFNHGVEKVYVNVKDCTFYGGFNTYGSDVIIQFTGCTFNAGADYCVLQTHGQMTFNDCTFAADWPSGAAGGHVGVASADAEAAGATVEFYNCTYGGGELFDLMENKTVGLFVVNPTKNDAGLYTGGTFNEEPAAALIAEGYAAAVNDDGYYVVSHVDHSWGNGVVTTNPSCEGTGVKTYTCSVCGKTKTETINATNHNYTSRVTSPTCTSRGYTTYTCSKCDDSYRGDYVSATGHDYSSVTVEPTCTEAGYTDYTCYDCGDSYTEDHAALGHSYEAKVTAPTCTAQGYTTHTCGACGDSYVDTYTAALGHTWDEGQVTTEATEETTGVMTYTCACGETKTEVIPVKGHTHNYTASVVAPTCTAAGYTQYTCACGNSYQADQVPALGHTLTDTVVPSTCTVQGYTTHTCSVCGHSYNDTYTAVLGHTWDNGKVTVAATADANGVKVYTCACGETKSETLPKLGHAFTSVTVAPTCTEQGYTEYTCTTCPSGTHTYRDSYVDALGHTMTDVVTLPTCTTRGYTTHTCTCGYSVIDNYVAATGHSYVTTVTKAPTGDTEGEMTYTCACGSTRTELIPKIGCTFTTEVTAPTCTEQGYTTYTCTACSAVHAHVSDYVPAKGHTLASVITAPTCTAQGYTTHTCTVEGCGYTLQSAQTEMLAHTYVYDSTTPATAETEGKILYKCACGAEKLEIIPAIGHSFQAQVTKEATCEAEGVITYTCTNCEKHSYTEVIPAKGHVWGEGVVTAATCVTSGYTAYTCTVQGCGSVRTTNHTAMKAHTFGTDGKCTGDGCTAKDLSKVTELVGTAQKTDQVSAGAAGYSSADQVLAVMQAAGGKNNVTSTLFDISLKADGVDLSANNFPAEGYVFSIPLPEGVDVEDVIITHMISETYGGHMAGDIEVLDHWLSEDGKSICFRTYSTSPVVMSIVEAAKGSLKGYTVTLGSTIGMNFYLALSDAVLADDGAYMLFTLPNGSTEKVYVKDVKGNGTTDVLGTPCYKFTCKVAVKEMTDAIKAQLVVDGKVAEECTYSVKEYAMYIVAHPSSYQAEEVALAKALLNFGASAQKMFQYNTYALANSELAANDQNVAQLQASALSGYAKQVSAAIQGVSYYGSSTVWEADMVIRHYFTSDDISKITFWLGETKLTPVAFEDMYYVEIDGIVAKDMEKTYVLTISNGTDTQTIGYSVYSYIYSVLAAQIGTYTNAQVAAVQYAYYYSQAAITCFEDKE